MSDLGMPAEMPDVPIPTDEELAAVPPEQDPYIAPKRDATGKFLPKDTESEAKPDEPAPAAAKPAEKPEPEKKPEAEDEDRTQTAREIANAKRYRKDLAKRERELNREAAEIAAQRAEVERLRTMRRDNPRALLDELGLTFRELAEQAARQDGEDPRDKAIRELREELADVKNFKQSLSKERETQQQQQNYQADVSAVASRLDADADAYPFLTGYGSERAASAAVNAWYEQERSGKTPDVLDILDSLEGELRADYERLHEAQSKRNGQPASSPAAQAAGAPGRVNGAAKSAKHVTEPSGKPSPATLTNRSAAERASPDRPLSRDDRRKLAASRIVIRD